MLSLLHNEYARAASEHRPRPALSARERRPHPPPGRLRRSAAQSLARLAHRLDSEAAQRAKAA